MLRVLMIVAPLALLAIWMGFVAPALHGGSPLFYLTVTGLIAACMPLVLRLEQRWHERSLRRRREATREG